MQLVSAYVSYIAGVDVTPTACGELTRLQPLRQLP